MFEYDRLALDVAEQVALVRQADFTFTSIAAMAAPRKSSDCSRRRNCSSVDAFDCASSGYGSPGLCSTPLPSPAGAEEVRRRLSSIVAGDFGFFDYDATANNNNHHSNNNSYNNSYHSTHGFDSNLLGNCGDLSSWLESSTDKFVADKQAALIQRQISNNPAPCTTVTPKIEEAHEEKADAEEDGFSAEEIAQFSQLLSCPKKAPPQKYQCHICYQPGHYISDCPMRFNCPYEELTPYQGRKKCYGEFQCQHCKRKWTSQNSIANEAQSCIKCHVAVFPHKQLPVDKAIAMGYIKSQKAPPAKLSPIGHGRRSGQ